MTRPANILPWDRAAAVRALSKPEFLAHEADLRRIDGHWNWLCDQERMRRGLFVPLARNYNFTTVAKHPSGVP